MRHACEQNDAMETYTWTEYDPRQGGVEIVKDDRVNLDLRIEWLKVPGGDAGGSWAVRFKGKPLSEGRSRARFLEPDWASNQVSQSVPCEFR